MGRHLVNCILPLLLVALAAPSTVFANIEDAESNTGFSEARLNLGYRFTESDKYPGNAAEYLRLQNSMVGAAHLASFRDQRHFYLDGNYLNPSDYTAELHYDYRGLLRIEGLAESLYHRLEHIPFPTETLRNPVNGTEFGTIFDQDPTADYHLEVRQSSVHARAKLPSYPAHLNLSYWRLERAGKQQLRYLDESCGGCHKQSISRNIERVTEEFTGSVDAHVGPVDLVLEQLVRLFRDREPTPVDTFQAHNYRTAHAASLQHDEDPDARLIATTVQAHSSLSGGLNLAAGFTIGNRKNQSDLTAVSPVEAKTDFTKTVGDVTYVPNPHWTFNLRYRLLDMDSSNSDQQILYDVLADPGANTLASIPVRDSLSLTRAWYSATGTWRPIRGVSVKGEYRRVDIDRSNTGGPGDPTLWNLPDSENRNTYRIGTYLRPTSVKGLKINGWYQYQTSDDPAYATTVARGHEGFAALTWAPTPVFGVNLNGRMARDENNDHSQYQAIDSGFARYPINRKSDADSLGAGIWLAPRKDLNFTFNYGFFHTRIVQDLIFGMDSVNQLTLEDEDVKFTQQVHTATAAATWRIIEAVSVMLEGRVSQAKAHYDPGFSTVRDFDLLNPADTLGVDRFAVDSSQLRELSEVNFRRYGLQAGVDWRAAEAWTCSARYSFDNYNDRHSNLLDGSAQTWTVTLARTW